MSVCLGWLFVASATITYAGQFALALAAAATGHVAELWHVYLAGLASLAVALCLNTVGVRMLNNVNKLTIVFANVFIVFLFVSLLAKTYPKADASTVFVDVANETGWSSDGLVFLLALLPGVSVVGMFDTAAHLSEELPRPDRLVPRVMIFTSMLSAFMTVVVTLALLFCLRHPENLLEPLGGMPILQLCWDAWPNRGYVVTVMACYTFSNILSVIGCVFAGSRLVWSFSKSGAFPFAEWLSKVNRRLKVPLNAVATFGVLSAIVILLILGPSTVLNALLGSAVILISVAYTMPIVLLLFKGRSVLPPNRSFNLGRAGIVVNSLALCWISLVVVFLSFPMYRPTTPDNMNWGTPCALGLLLLTVLNWFVRKGSYRSLHGLYTEGLHGAPHGEIESGLGQGRAVEIS